MKKRDSTCLALVVLLLVFKFYLFPVSRNVTHSTKTIIQGMHYKTLLYSLHLLCLCLCVCERDTLTSLLRRENGE